MIKRIFALVILFGVLGLHIGAAQQRISPAVDQTLFLTFVPNIQFAPVYMALEKGYFERGGINLTLEHGDEPLGVDLIAAGERQFGLVGGEQVIAAREQGRPVVFVYQWFQRYPIAVIATVESGITSVDDLRGRRVGLPGRFGATYSGLVALLAANGLSERDVEIQEIGFNAPEVICVGAIEAAAVYSNNEPLQIANRIAADDCGDVTGLTVFNVADQVQLVSNGLITNEDTLINQPELVRRMTEGFDDGVRDVLANPAEAYLLSAEYIETLPMTDELRAALEAAAEDQRVYRTENPLPEKGALAERHAALLTDLEADFDADTLIQLRVLLETMRLWEADTLGYTAPEAWENTQQTLITMGFLDAPIDLRTAFTNDFLPDAVELHGGVGLD